METIKLFFNSNFFIALVTFIVGSFAIFLYIKQKVIYKRNAASLILQEIRYAEQQIRNAKESVNRLHYPLSIKLLPTNSWHENIHLFISQLKETDIDLISRFYAKAIYIDKLIAMISELKGPMRVIVDQQTAQQNPQEAQPKNQQTEPKKQEEIVSMKFFAQIILEEITNEVEFIYNTPVVEKLRKTSTQIYSS